VDAKRIGITGGSGGGTQTILLGAIDSRPIVSFPQGMVSTAMQGGCTCENCSLLRVDTGNVELAGLFAPRPLAMTGANDWTKEIQSKGYPELQKLYGLYGKQEDVFCVSFLHFAHNYNYVTRQVMYHWFNKHMELGLKEPIVEDDYELLTTAEITVWDDEHPQPESGVEHEVKLLRSIAQSSQRQISKLVNTAEDPVAKVREIVGTAVQSIVMRELPAAGVVELEQIGEAEYENYSSNTLIFRHKAAGEEFPAIVFYPNTVEWNGTMILWIDGQGKSGMIGENGKPNKAIAAALAKGSAVIGIDMLYQGEFLAAGEKLDEQRSAPTTNRQVPAFTFAYNHTLFSHRVHDVLSLISYMSGDVHSTKEVELILVGTGGAGPIAATAGAIAGDAVQQVIIDTQGFRFASITSYLDPNFFPGAIKYGDLPAILALNAPRPLILIGEKTVPRKTGFLYSRMGKQVRLAENVWAALQLK
ncbi:MAG: acetylxylan esterase, partial [Pirellulaceae bacterium]